MKNKDTSKSLIYQFLDHNNEPFYVGKTNNLHRRKQEHKKDLKKKANLYVYRKITKLIRDHNYKLKIDIVSEGLSESEANAMEITLIKKYRDKGYKLSNLTDGGDGTLGHVPVFTDEWRKNLSEAAKKRVARDGVPFKGKKHSDETKKKLSQVRKGKMQGKDNPFYGKHHTEELKKANAERARKLFSGKKQNKEHKEKRRQAMIKKFIKATPPNKKTFIWKDSSSTLSDFLLKEYGYKVARGTISTYTKSEKTLKSGWKFKYIERF